MLVLIGMLVIGIVWLIARPHTWLAQVSATVSAIAGKSQVTRNDLEQKPKPFGGDRVEHAKPSQAKEDTESEKVTVQISPILRVQAQYPFPLAGDIVTGTSRSTIVAMFGPPHAKVTGTDTGQLRERYIYMENATGRKTAIFLVNGNITTAETTNP